MMIDLDQAALDEVFPNNPLREVAFEIRFPMNLRVMRDVCEVQEELRGEYPELNREETFSPTAPTEVGFIFSNSERGRIVKVWENRFAMMFTRYESFEAFKAEIIKRTQRFCEMFRIDRFTRVGLRYINNILIPVEDKNVPLARYVRSYLGSDFIKSTQVKQFALQILMQREDFVLNTRSAIVPQQQSSEQVTYVLDFDAFVERETRLEELSSLLDRFHHHIQVEFLTHVTEEYKQYMRGQR